MNPLDRAAALRILCRAAIVPVGARHDAQRTLNRLEHLLATHR